MEKVNANDSLSVSLSRGAALFGEGAQAEGFYKVECYDANGILKWAEDIHNVVCTEGKNANLHHFLKGSSYTASQVMGLIGNVTYSAPVAGNTAGAIATSASGNNWNEATLGVSFVRQTPSFAVPSAGSVTLTAASSFSITGTDTINGVFVLCRSVAGVAPTTAVGNTSGAIWSAGAFSSAKAVSNGDTLSVTYTTNLNG
jgi:hypothetical protein